MKGTVDSVTKSKTGKSWRVKIGSEFYGANFDSKIDGAVGKYIDFEWDDGQFGKWLKSWGPEHTQAPVMGAAVPAQGGPRSNGDRWWLPFVSNQCAHAIAAGHIKGAADLKAWAIAAKEAAGAADEHDSIPF